MGGRDFECISSLAPPLRSRWHTLRRRALLIPILLLAGTAEAQSPDGREAYTNVRAARELARRLGTRPAVRAFVKQAERFLERFPTSGRADIVELCSYTGDVTYRKPGLGLYD